MLIPIEDFEIPKIMTEDWPDFSKPVTKKVRRSFRRKMKSLSLNDQEGIWKSIQEAYPARFAECESELRVLRRRAKAILSEAPSEAWYDDARKLPLNQGGEWPPGGYNKTPMVKARGELMLYPPQMIVSSGHSYDVYIQDIMLNHHTQHLLPDGYNGSIISIYDLHHTQRRTVRKESNGKHGASNVMSGLVSGHAERE